jgi:hypothetical protein
LIGAGLAAVMLLAAPAAHAVPSPCDLRYPSDERVEWDCETLRRGQTLESRFGDRWPDVARFNRIDRRHAGPGVRLKVPRRLEAVDCFTPLPAEYLEAVADSKFVLVDLTEQFIGAYEHGKLVFSAPITAGIPSNPTPAGDFRITAFDRQHVSSRYFIEGTTQPYPMHWGLRFHVAPSGVSYWIHSRDVPGYPASHGCVGLYDETMQKACYGNPRDPVLDDAERLYRWAVGGRPDDGLMHALPEGPRVEIVGRAPSGTASD